MSRLSYKLGGLIASRAWNAVLLLGLVPIYIRVLGVEAYGVVGAFLALQSFISLLDLGMGTTLTRELARMSAVRGHAQEMRNLLRTLELAYLLVSFVIAFAVWVVSPLVATDWLRLGAMPALVVEHGIATAGIALAVQWPKNLYSAGLEGLQKQTTLAWLNAVTSTIRGAITISALEFVAPTLEAFFLAQLVSNAIQTAMMAIALWSSMPNAPHKASFSMPLLRAVRRFASGMTGISITSVALTQLDKVVLSRTLSLKVFGYYVIASTLAGGLYVIVSPIFAVVFPRLSELVSQNRDEVVAQFYDTSAQLMSVALLPVAAVIALNSPEVLKLWTGESDIAMHGHVLLSLVVLGNAMNGLMNVPYAMQLAHGWTALALWSNVIATMICVPLTYFLSVHFGAVGGAMVWVLLTLAYILCSMPLMHRRLLLGRLPHWYLVDIGMPAVVAFGVVALGKALVPAAMSPAASIAILACLTIVACIGTSAAAPNIRQVLIRRLLASGSMA